MTKSIADKIFDPVVDQYLNESKKQSLHETVRNESLHTAHLLLKLKTQLKESVKQELDKYRCEVPNCSVEHLHVIHKGDIMNMLFGAKKK